MLPRILRTVVQNKRVTGRVVGVALVGLGVALASNTSCRQALLENHTSDSSARSSFVLSSLLPRPISNDIVSRSLKVSSLILAQPIEESEVNNQQQEQQQHKEEQQYDTPLKQQEDDILEQQETKATSEESPTSSNDNVSNEGDTNQQQQQQQVEQKQQQDDDEEDDEDDDEEDEEDSDNNNTTSRVNPFEITAAEHLGHQQIISKSALEFEQARIDSSRTPDGMIVALAGVRAQEFIELEKHYKQQLQQALKEKDNELRARLEQEREKLHEKFQEDIEEYREHVSSALEQEFIRQRTMVESIAISKHKVHLANIDSQYQQQMQQLEIELRENMITASKDRIETLTNLSNRLSSLEDSLAKKEQQAAADLRSQQICLAIFALSSSALDKPGPFKKQLDRALAVTTGHEVIQEALTAIPKAITDRGVLPMQELSANFKTMRNIGRRDALVPQGGGMWWELFASGIAAITSPVRGWVEGDDPDAIFARAEYYLERGNLNGSISELSKLKGMASVAARSWIEDARDRLAVELALLTVRNYVTSALVQEEEYQIQAKQSSK